MNQDSKRPVTLEDILRLKRAERPPAEFWDRFDRELRAKQLSALVQRRPWWRSAGGFLAGLRPYHLPVGAAAILALTFVAVRENRLPVPAEVTVAPLHVEGRSGVALAVADANSTATSALTLVAVASEPMDVTAEGVATAEDIAVDASAPAAAEKASELPIEKNTPSARAIAANLAAAQAEIPVATRTLLAPSRGFESRALPARATTVEPLQQMTTPAQMRSARLLTAMVALSNDSSPRTERVASRISGEQLYDVARRLSAKGDSFSVKF